MISCDCHVMALPPSLADATRDPMEDEGKKLIEILSSPQAFQTAYLVRTTLFRVQHSVSIPYMSKYLGSEPGNEATALGLIPRLHSPGFCTWNEVPFSMASHFCKKTSEEENFGFS